MTDTPRRILEAVARDQAKRDRPPHTWPATEDLQDLWGALSEEGRATRLLAEADMREAAKRGPPPNWPGTSEAMNLWASLTDEQRVSIYIGILNRPERGSVESLERFAAKLAEIRQAA